MHKYFGFLVIAAMVTAVGCGDSDKEDKAKDEEVEPENTKEACEDGIDNDKDGDIDYRDSECEAFLPEVVVDEPASPETEIEFDGIDGKVQNPIVSHVFTADPSANVFDGRIYIYASHDKDEQDDYDMTDYHVFSSDDLVNWTDHGVALDAADISWTGKLYAPDAAYSEKTGKYYLYFPNSGSGIGVAVSDNPYGPFEDALGEPLVSKQTPGVRDVNWIFDPTCFVDDDGQAYLYFGGGMPDTGDNLRVIRLGDDMISLADDEATTIVAPDFFEAAFVHKLDGTYYLSYSTTFAEHSAMIDYLTSDDPMTGFEYQGTVLPNPTGNNGNNNHHSIVAFEGDWYIFYHNRVLSNELGLSDYQRSITLDHLKYDDDGNIETVSAKHGEVDQLKPLDAFVQHEAESMAGQQGIEVDFVKGGQKNAEVMVTDIHNEDFIAYSQVDFGDGAVAFIAEAASDAADGGKIHLFIDGCDLFADLKGKQIGTCEVESTKGWQEWTEVRCGIKPTKGVHDLYLRFEGENDEPLLNLDYFRFN